MIKVYIAAPFSMQQEAERIQRVLELKKMKVTARWITMEKAEIRDEPYLQMWAQNDLDDVAAADVLLAISPFEYIEKGTGGRHVELGYALALKIPVILYGFPTNIFHHHPLVKCIAGGDFIKAIQNAAETRKTQSSDSAS